MGYRETKLDNASQSRGLFFIEPDDEDFKHTVNACRTFEIPMSAAMLCKTPVNCRGDTCRNIGKHKDQICLYC